MLKELKRAKRIPFVAGGRDEVKETYESFEMEFSIAHAFELFGRQTLINKPNDLKSYTVDEWIEMVIGLL